MLSKLASGAGSVSAESGISSTARPASRARHHPRPLAAHHPKTAGAVDQPGEQEAGVEGGGVTVGARLRLMGWFAQIHRYVVKG
jgi:hypothetical protein